MSFFKLWHDCFASLAGGAGGGRRWIRGWFFDADFDRISRVRHTQYNIIQYNTI